MGEIYSIPVFAKFPGFEGFPSAPIYICIKTHYTEYMMVGKGANFTKKFLKIECEITH